jgi:hypothetical protein
MQDGQDLVIWKQKHPDYIQENKCIKASTRCDIFPIGKIILQNRKIIAIIPDRENLIVF